MRFCFIHPLFLNCIFQVFSLTIRGSGDASVNPPEQLSAESSPESYTNGDCYLDASGESIDGVQTRSPLSCNPSLSTDLSAGDTSSVSRDDPKTNLMNPESYTVANVPTPQTNRNERLCPYSLVGPREYSLCDSGRHYDLKYNLLTLDLEQPTACT